MRNPFRHKPKTMRFPNWIPVVATGGKFSVSIGDTEAKDIPYCASGGEIQNYYTNTAYLEKRYRLLAGEYPEDLLDPSDVSDEGYLPWERRITDPDYE